MTTRARPPATPPGAVHIVARNVQQRLFAPTTALAATLPGPPDADGRRWRSHVSRILAERARAGGGDEATVLRDFLAAVPIASAEAARIEAGLSAPPPWYRARAATILGREETDVFEALPPGRG